jgi:hypothetical protein
MNKIKKISIEELDKLLIPKLIERMDEIITADSFYTRGNEICGLNVSKMMNTEKARKLEPKIQRDLAFEIFRMLMQKRITDISLSPQYKLPGNEEINKQFSWIARNQWMIISSRILFEYFMNIIYMVETGKKLGSKNRFNKIKNWLKKENNDFTPLAILIARVKKYSRTKREPEIHFGSNFTKEIITLSADKIDNSIFGLTNYLNNYWQYVIQISNNEKMVGHPIYRDEFNDKEWYKLLEKNDKKEINFRIDNMFTLAENTN